MEKNLVYATVFGISEKVVQQLKVMYSESYDLYCKELNNCRIANNADLINRIDNVFLKACNTASYYHNVTTGSSYSSGSGGGGDFSSGGGGRMGGR